MGTLLLDAERITGYIHLCVSRCRTDLQTDCWIKLSGQTCLTVKYLDKTVVSSESFHYCNLVGILKSTSVDCNYCFNY